MSHPLPRYQPEPDPNKINRIILETGEPTPTRILNATAGGDERRLRGIPAIGRGVAGAITGTRPEDSIRY